MSKMSAAEILIWGGVVTTAGVALAWPRGRDVVVDTVVDVFSRGNRLTYGEVGADGVVPVAPAELAKAAAIRLGRPLSLEIYAMARMVRSEGAAAGKIRAHVAINDALELGWSMISMLTYSTNSAHRGWFGEQRTAAARARNGATSVRRYATTKDPYVGDVELVETVLAERAMGIDPTDRAVKFVDISAMGGVQSGTGSYADLVARWGRDGLVPANVPGYSKDLVVFRRIG